MPEYELIEWNEENTNLSIPFIDYFYKRKQWAYVSDYVRLLTLYDHGGIYLDTDVLVLKSFKELENNNCFLGFEEHNRIAAGIIGAERGNQFLKACLDYYNQMKFDVEIKIENILIPELITKVYNDLNKDLSNKAFKVRIFNEEFFYPVSFYSRLDVRNYRKYITKNSYAVHLWYGSWLDHSIEHYINMKEYKKAIFYYTKKDLNLFKIDTFLEAKKYFKYFLSSIKDL